MLGLDLGLDARSRLDARRSIFWSRLDARRSIFDGFGNARGYPSYIMALAHVPVPALWQ